MYLASYLRHIAVRNTNVVGLTKSHAPKRMEPANFERGGFRGAQAITLEIRCREAVGGMALSCKDGIESIATFYVLVLMLTRLPNQVSVTLDPNLPIPVNVYISCPGYFPSVLNQRCTQ